MNVTSNTNLTFLDKLCRGVILSLFIQESDIVPWTQKVSQLCFTR